MTSGTGILTVGLHQYVLGAGDIAFLHPDELISRQKTSVHTGGHFCLIHPRYFEHDADHVLQLLRNPPYFKASKAVIQLTKNQSAVVNSDFESMVKEDRGNSVDKNKPSCYISKYYTFDRFLKITVGLKNLSQDLPGKPANPEKG